MSTEHDHPENKLDNQDGHSHHILPIRFGVMIGAVLLAFTVFTVWIAGIDLGSMNFFVAMLVATIKASLVVLIFMGLKYDLAENRVIFGTAFIFAMIFVVLASTDVFFRGDVYAKGPFFKQVAGAPGAVKFKKPWIKTPELLARGKEVFTANCTACHGTEGKGDGAAAAALNPKPRNFVSGTDWKKARKLTLVFETTRDGIKNSPMPPFGTLPADDLWAVSHFVLSLGQAPEADVASDFVRIGVDPSQDGTTQAVESKSISIEEAIELMAEDGKRE